MVLNYTPGNNNSNNCYYTVYKIGYTVSALIHFRAVLASWRHILCFGSELSASVFSCCKETILYVEGSMYPFAGEAIQKCPHSKMYFTALRFLNRTQAQHRASFFLGLIFLLHQVKVLNRVQTSQEAVGCSRHIKCIRVTYLDEQMWGPS